MSMRNNDDPNLNGIDATVFESLLESIAPVAPPVGLRNKILQRARASVPEGHFITLRQQEGWRDLLPGVRVKVLFVDHLAGTKSFLLHAAPGTRLPEHQHHGDEECLVLEGEFTLGDLTLRAGDFHSALKDSKHGSSFTEHGVLVYLRASVHDYPGV